MENASNVMDLSEESGPDIEQLKAHLDQVSPRGIPAIAIESTNLYTAN